MRKTSEEAGLELRLAVIDLGLAILHVLYGDRTKRFLWPLYERLLLRRIEAHADLEKYREQFR
jgi:hypothetical protein